MYGYYSGSFTSNYGQYYHSRNRETDYMDVVKDEFSPVSVQDGEMTSGTEDQTSESALSKVLKWINCGDWKISVESPPTSP